MLAAGAGSRAGGPKALRPGWLRHAVDVLAEAGCDERIVVLGAEADRARALVPAGCEVVVARDWATGMSASLRAGLEVADGDAVLITLVDLPGMPATVARRMAALARRDVLAQASYRGRPGHPVLIGAQHRAAVSVAVSGDRGAREFLVAHGVVEVACGDLWDGADRDAG